MLTASLHSTWDAQRQTRQKPRYTNSYQNYGGDDSETINGNADRGLNGKSLFATQGYAPTQQQQGNRNDSYNSELPNLKIPQVDLLFNRTINVLHLFF